MTHADNADSPRPGAPCKGARPHHRQTGPIAADLETWQSYLDLGLENPDSGQVTVTSSARGLRYLSGEYGRLHAKRKNNFSE